MIKNFKSKKLIMQVIAFLLMFTFMFSSVFTTKVNAVDLHDGDRVTVKMHTSSTCSYTIHATYSGGGWTVDEVQNNILANGNKTDMPSFWLSIIKSYGVETGSSTTKGMVVKAIEYYVEKTQKTITSDRVNGTNTKEICSYKDGKIKWGTSSTGSNYKTIISNGNPGLNYNLVDGDPIIINPLLTVDPSQMDDTFKSLQVDGTPLTSMTDLAWLTLVLDEEKNPSWITVTYDTSGGMITADASGYYAKLEIPDENKKSGNILIKVYDKNDKNVVDFKFGEIVDVGKYREITYSNMDRKEVIIYGSGENMYMTLKAGHSPSNLSLYKLASGSTIDSYKSQIKVDSLFKWTKEIECYAAIKDAALNVVDIYGAFESVSSEAKLTKLCSVDLKLLEELFGEKSFNLITGGWVFELAKGKDDVVIGYKENDPDPETNGWYFYLDELKTLRVKTSGYYDLMVPTKEGKNGSKLTTQPGEPDRPFSVLRGNPTVDGKDASLIDLREALYNEILNGHTVYCSARTLRYDGKTGTNSNELKLGDTYSDENEPAGKDYPPEFPINDFLLITEDLQDKLEGNQQILNEIYAKLGESKTEIKHEFVDDVLKYGKIIILFLILLALCYTAILSIQSSVDIKKRVLIKTRMRDILIGAIIFACVIPIFNLVMNFLADSYQSLGQFTGDFSGPTYYATITRFKVGYIVKFIGKVIDTFTLGINWLIDTVLSYSMTPGASTNLMELIFVATDNSGFVSSILPFTEAEWSMYVMGYRLLTVLFLGFVAIALVKVAMEFMIGAGNPTKIEASKESIKRIIVAILMVVLAPYGFRLLLLFFNYLTSMLPIDGGTAVFDINFEAAGFVGSFANLLFATTRFKIFVTFFVRKVMLALMLFSTPFICGIWAVSNKFRSFTLWVGTILSNAALQFCYALVFMVVILISYEGQNPFVTLIVVLLIPKFASFFSQSLQGLGQVWGGINSEAIATQVVNSYKGWGRKGISKVKGTGRNLMKAAKKYDPKAISKTGRRVHNAGAILSGQFLDVRTKGDTLRNRAALAQQDYLKDKKVFDNAARNRKMALMGRFAGDKVFDYDRAIAAGDLETARSLRDDSAEFDIIDDYYDAQKQANYSYNLYEGINSRATSTNFKDQGYLGTPQALINKAIDKSMYNEIDYLYDNLNGTVSRTREASKGRKGSDEALNKILQKAEVSMQKRKANGKARTPEEINMSVDKVFKDLISYMENAESKTTVQLEITDAIFAGLFAKKAEVNGFSPEMAVKYQETKDQYFGDVDKAIVKAVEKAQTAEAMAATSAPQTTTPEVKEQITPIDNHAVGESMVSVSEEQKPTQEEKPQQQAQTKSQTKPEEKPSDGLGESMLGGAGEKITPGAGGKVTAGAGEKAFDDSFSIENNTTTGFDVTTETYASEHGQGGEEGAGGDAKPKEPESRPQPPMKKDNLNLGNIGEQSTEKVKELIKHHDTSYSYDTVSDKVAREEKDISKVNFDEKELLDEERLKKIAETVKEMSAEDPYQDADEVVKKAIEQFVENELKKERKIDHQPTLRNPDYNQKPKK